jgi:hypothetical protein
MSGNRVTIARVRKRAKPLEIAIDVPIGSAELQRTALAPPLAKIFPVIGPEIGDGGNGHGADNSVVIGPAGSVDRGTGGGRVATRKIVTIAGLSLGGALVIAGTAMWFRVASLQDEIDSAPDATLSDLYQLDRLEDRAEATAGRGNFLVGLGVVVAGSAATYWLLGKGKPRRETPVTAWIAADGGGVAVTLRR